MFVHWIFRTEKFRAYLDINKFNIYTFIDWVFEVGGISSAPVPVAELYAVCEKKIELTRLRNEKKCKENTNAKITNLKDVRAVLQTQPVVQFSRGSVVAQNVACRGVCKSFSACVLDNQIWDRSSYLAPSIFLTFLDLRDEVTTAPVYWWS